MNAEFGNLQSAGVLLKRRRGLSPARGQVALWEGERLTLDDSIALTIQSLRIYAEQYRHWVICFSGGKDSTTVVTLIPALIAAGHIPAPQSLTVLYSDTRQEIPPLHLAALQTLDALRNRGITCQVVIAPCDDRFFVYMFGRGVPPPNNQTLRWCTSQLKIEPMQAALASLRQQHGEKFLMLTGVRIGESAARDQRIAVSCARNGAECGQGWFQVTTPEDVADTLAPIAHWRVCHVWDWLFLHAPAIATSAALVAEVYGGDEAIEMNARTGCIGCPLAEQDTALDYVISQPDWAYLAPLKRLKPLYRDLRRFRNRLQKDGERNKDGKLSSNPNRKGPLTMEARRHALREVVAVQREINHAARRRGRPRISLISWEEFRRIRELQRLNTWPDRWTGDEPRGDVLIAQVLAEGITQELLLTLEDGGA